MSQNTTIARPYAKAAFEVAQTSGDLTRWADMLHVVAAVVTTSKVAQYLSSPSLSGEQQAATVASLCGDEIDDRMVKLLGILADNKRLSLMPEIVELFDVLKAIQEKRVDVEVVSAYALDEAAENKLKEALKKRLQREVSLSSRVDQSLLGGLVLRADDLVIDGSLRGRLNKLAEAMNS